MFCVYFSTKPVSSLLLSQAMFSFLSGGLSSRSAWMSSSRPPPPLCVYKVTVRTGSAPGTISRAYITLQGSKGTLKRRRLAKGGKKDFTFVSGRSDVFRIRGKDVGDITNVTSEWRLLIANLQEYIFLDHIQLRVMV